MKVLILCVVGSLLIGCSPQAIKWAADNCMLPGDETGYKASCPKK